MDPGLVPNSDCNGCVVTDICLADNPCINNGTCILNSAPNDYTCSCPLYYTGKNCEGNNCYSSLVITLCIGTKLFDASSCSGADSNVCQGRRLSAACKSIEMSARPLPARCDKLQIL